MLTPWRLFLFFHFKFALISSNQRADKTISSSAFSNNWYNAPNRFASFRKRQLSISTSVKVFATKGRPARMARYCFRISSITIDWALIPPPMTIFSRSRNGLDVADHIGDFSGEDFENRIDTRIFLIDCFEGSSAVLRILSPQLDVHFFDESNCRTGHAVHILKGGLAGLPSS